MTLPSRGDVVGSQHTNQSFLGGWGRIGRGSDAENMMEAWKMMSRGKKYRAYQGQCQSHLLERTVSK